MGKLSSALGALAVEDLFPLSAPELLDRTRALVAARNRIEAELARTVRRAELAQAPERDGLRTRASWLRGHCRFSPSPAGQLVRAGRALERLPALAAAFAEGDLTADQVDLIGEITRPGHVIAAGAEGVELGAVDELLTGVATGRPHSDLVQVVAHYLGRLHPDGPEPDPTEQRLLTFLRHRGGSYSGRFALDAVGGEKLQAAVESIVQADRPAGDERSRAQRQADALVQLADNALAYGDLPQLRTVKPQLRTVKPQLVVMIADADRVDPAVRPAAAETGLGGSLLAARARWAACDGAGHPDRAGRRRAAAGRRPQPAAGPGVHPARGRAPGPGLHLHRPLGPDLVVRHPSQDRVGLGRPDLAGQPRPSPSNPPEGRASQGGPGLCTKQAPLDATGGTVSFERVPAGQV